MFFFRLQKFPLLWFIVNSISQFYFSVRLFSAPFDWLDAVTIFPKQGSPTKLRRFWSKTGPVQSKSASLSKMIMTASDLRGNSIEYLWPKDMGKNWTLIVNFAKKQSHPRSHLEQSWNGSTDSPWYSHHQPPKVSFPGLGLPPDPVQVPASPKPSGRPMWSYRRARQPHSWPKSLGMVTIKSNSHETRRQNRRYRRLVIPGPKSPSCILKPQLLAKKQQEGNCLV